MVSSSPRRPRLFSFQPHRNAPRSVMPSLDTTVEWSASVTCASDTNLHEGSTGGVVERLPLHRRVPTCRSRHLYAPDRRAIVPAIRQQAGASHFGSSTPGCLTVLHSKWRRRTLRRFNRCRTPTHCGCNDPLTSRRICVRAYDGWRWIGRSEGTVRQHSYSENVTSTTTVSL